jgi:hypothetical protein
LPNPTLVTGLLKVIVAVKLPLAVTELELILKLVIVGAAVGDVTLTTSMWVEETSLFQLPAESITACVFNAIFAVPTVVPAVTLNL